MLLQVGEQSYELDERLQRGAYLAVDRERKLTPLGRVQAAAAGDRCADAVPHLALLLEVTPAVRCPCCRLAQILAPAPTTPGFSRETYKG